MLYLNLIASKKLLKNKQRIKLKRLDQKTKIVIYPIKKKEINLLELES
jgi:hypothetical protein